MTKPEKSDTVKEYLIAFPNTGDQTLAKKIFKETGLLFDTAEQVRDMVRMYRGKQGELKKSMLTDRRFIREEAVQSENNIYDLPETDALEYPVFKFPRVQNRIIIAPDAHVPYHDVDAITCMIDWAKEHQTNTILLNGDWLDCHLLSSFVRDPRKKNFTQERKVLWEMLDKMQNALPDVVFYYKQGNHERRYENYMKIKAPELFDTEEFEFDVLMKFGEKGIIYIGDKRRIQAGGLTILHGDEYKGGTTAVNPARWLFLKAQASAMCAHFHQVSEHSEPDINDDITTCWSVGALCNLHPEYSPLNRWSHGFARVIVNPDDTFKVTNLRIHNGKVL